MSGNLLENILDPDLTTGLLLSLGLAALFTILFLLALWARKRSKGALVAGALLSMFAPDPTLERNIRMAEEAKQTVTEEDEEGEGKD